MSEKAIGYLLLVIGLIVMVFCVVNVLMVFTNKIKPFQIFNVREDQSKSSAGSLNLNDLVSNLQNEGSVSSLNQTLQMPNLNNILPTEVLNKSLNLTTHFFLMSFILSFGGKLAGMGIQLIRPIKVKLTSKVVEDDSDKSSETPVSSLRS